MAKIVGSIILQLRYLSSYKDILNKLEQEVEMLNGLRESIIHEDEAGIRDGEVIEDEAVRWLDKADKTLRDADELLIASRNANAVCFPNLKSRHQLGRLARKLTADLHDLSAVKFELGSRKWMKENIVSTPKEPDEMNKIGIYGLVEGVGDKTTLVKTVIKTVDDKLFDGVIMTRVSETLDPDRIQCEIAEQLGFHLEEMTSERAGSLNEILKKEKSILIIFYDVGVEIDLEKLGVPLEDHHKGCKLLLISRNQHILQENEIEKFSFRLKFLNDAELWSLCQSLSGAGVNEHDEKEILEPTNHSSLKRICNELEDKVLQIFSLCGVYGKSILVSDLELNGFCCNGSEFLGIPTLCSNKEALFRPLKHLKLVGISGIMLLVITALAKGMAPLQNLETLEIVGGNDLQYLFVIKGLNMYGNYSALLPDLHQLRLCNLVKLRSIVGLNHPRGTLSFKMLKDLTVCSCNELRYVLPLYVLQNLHQLEKIVINDCKMLERVFGDEERDTQMTKSNENTVDLRQVNTLILTELPKFTGCCQDGCLVNWLSLKKITLVECPMIKEWSMGMIDRPLLTSVEVIECNTWANNEDPELNIIHLFHLTDELSKLEHLKIKDSEDLRKYMAMELQPSSFRRLKSLQALQCGQELTKFLSTKLLPRSHELEELTIESCKLLEQVFKLEDLAPDTQVTRIFPKLRTMRLNRLPKLNYICNNDPIISGTVKLGNLDKLEIIDCDFLKGPFPTTLLEKLVTLKIESCEMIEQVVEENAKMQGRLFCNLDDLQLVSLPKLTKFNSGHCNLTIPNLRNLKIEKCPELNAFTTGFLSNQTTNEGTSYDVPRDEKMDACLKLQTLKLEGNKTLEEIWKGGDSNINITDCELEEVEVDSFNKLRNIFPSSMLPKLSEKLVKLVVRNCSSLSDVFRLMSGNHSIKAFQNLKIVRLKGCDSLQRLLLPCNYPNLTEIDISDCQNLVDIFIDTTINAEEKCFPNLKSIILENLPRLSSFSLEAFEFPKLDKDSPFGHGKTILLPQLQVLGLSDLPKMQPWNREPQIPVFEKLTSLKIIGCKSIEYLFTITVAQHLSSLKSLTLYKCENMVQVLQGGGGNSVTVFQELETLVLKHLPILSSFCEDKDVDFGKFPKLRMVRVEDIPKMHTFVKKPLKTPELKHVHVIFIRQCWQGNLNQTIEYLQQNHEKLKVEAWESDQSSTRHHTDTAASSSSSQGKFEIEGSSGR